MARFIVLLLIAGVGAAIDALAVRVGLPDLVGLLLLLGLTAVGVVGVMSTPQWSRSIAQSRESTRD